MSNRQVDWSLLSPWGRGVRLCGRGTGVLLVLFSFTSLPPMFYLGSCSTDDLLWFLCGSAGTPVQNEETGLTEFQLLGSLQYLTWYHAVGLVWISEFILACQQMVVAGAVVTYYFTR